MVSIVVAGGCASPGNPGQVDRRAELGTNPAGPVPALWTNVIQASVFDGSSLIRDPGGGSAGASSTQRIDTGAGFVQFSTSESNLGKMAGLGHSDDNQDLANIDYGILLRNDGTIEIYEQGWYKGSFGPYAPGDVFSRRGRR